jgi:DNA replication licensing factor MCM5
MAGFGGQVYTTNLRGGPASAAMMAADQDPDRPEDMAMADRTDAKAAFTRFLSHFVLDGQYVYVDALRTNLAANLNFLEVYVEHVKQFSEALGSGVCLRPTRLIPAMEEAAAELATSLKLYTIYSLRKEIQVQLQWATEPLKLRHLAQEAVASLICVSGIVVKASSTHARCVRATIQCTSCRQFAVVAGPRALDLPAQCMHNGGGEAGQGGGGGGGGGGPLGGGGQRGKCRPNPYVLLPHQCEFEDQQVLKIQELPEDVPTGELPRHLTVVVDRYLVDKASPGSRVQITAIVSVQEKKSNEKVKGGGGGGGGHRVAGLRAHYLRCTGIMLSQGIAGYAVSVNENYSSRMRSRTAAMWQQHEEAAFKAFARSGNVYKTVAEAIDPAIFGLELQKRAIACLLFGGTRKVLEGNYLRGDMNVLLIGDPSTAKSQLLKFTERIAPIGIYTSGKGSSAAGLTATVAGTGGGDFHLEAGSMVLADGGVVCIDEFDKMREQDQVAIHEAMEQQTISIAKANLTTMLNSRTSVLAAANPTLGSYDPLRSNEEQMDFQGSILSRFDLIFKIIDPKDRSIDTKLALHIVMLHKEGGQKEKDSLTHRGRWNAAAKLAAAVNGARANPKGGAGNRSTGEASTLQSHSPDGRVNLAFLTKYIAYAKATCRPVISSEATAALLDFYVQVRKEAHDAAVNAAKSGSAAPAIQITPRQLESLVRITESLAKMRLEDRATAEDAEEAIRLFRASTVDAIASGIVESNMTEAQSEAVLKIEELIRRRVPVGATVLHSRLVGELSRMDLDARLIDRALFIMMRRDEFEWRKQRTMVHRLR